MPVQTQIIESVNRVLQNNKAYMKLNTGGVCGGLACVFVSYVLRGKKQQFFDLSKKLANLSADYKLGDDENLDNFIKHIEEEFNRDKYTRGQQYQGDMTGVSIDGKPIRKEFTLGLVDDLLEWALLLDSIKREGRACYVRSHNHAVALEFVDGKFELYDPNYDEDSDSNKKPKAMNIRRFDNAAELIVELGSCFSYSLNSPVVGLGIIVYAHPKSPKAAAYPNKRELLQRRLASKAACERIIDVKKNAYYDYNSLFFAAVTNDVESIDHLLNQKADEEKNMKLLMKMSENNDLVFRFFEGAKIVDQLLLMQDAVWAGNPKLFARMIQDFEQKQVQTDAQKEQFKGLFPISLELIQSSAATFPSCMPQVLMLYKKYGVEIPILQLSRIIANVSKLADAELLGEIVAQLPKLQPNHILIGVGAAVEVDNRSALTFWLNSLRKVEHFDDKNLFTQELLSSIPLITYKALLHAGFVVKPIFYRDLLTRNEAEFFELAAKSNRSDHWCKFVKQLNNGTLKSPINLCQEIEGLTALEVLISYQKNELIAENWKEFKPKNTDPKLLAFACKCANKTCVSLLIKEGYRIRPEEQRTLLQRAIDGNDLRQIDAILASHIEYQHFFKKTNEKLLNKLIGIGYHQFFINILKNNPASSSDHLSIDDLLYSALTHNNEPLYEYLATQYPRVATTTLRAMIAAKHPDMPIFIMRLGLAIDVKTFDECMQDITHDYNEKLHHRETRDDEVADRKFKEEARAEIQPLCDLSIFAIKNHYFEFADRLAQIAPLSRNELHDLFVAANEANDRLALDYLLGLSSLYSNGEMYIKLAESNHFDALAVLLEQNKVIDQKSYSKLLELAVAAKSARVIALLHEHINKYHSPAGSPIYKAIQNNDHEGCLLLLKNVEAVNDPLILQKIFHFAVREKNPAILAELFNKKDFIDYFNASFASNLEYIILNGESAVVGYAYNKLSTDQRFYPDYLEKAIKSDDVNLLKQLKTNEAFATLNKNELFEQACKHQALGIVNELLVTTIDVKDKAQLFTMLDALFSKVENKDAKALYDVIYDKAYKKPLLRLYEFLKENKYRPFASLHADINELMDDPGLAKHKTLKNRLVEQALDEGDAEVLHQLLGQVSENQEVDAQVVGVFAAQLDKPTIIKTLLEHYNLADVLNSAIEQKQYALVAVLLKDLKADALSAELKAKLKVEQVHIARAVIDEAKKHLKSDPRQQLNQILISDSNLALTEILSWQDELIADGIMSIQEMMSIQHIDLSQQVYRFDSQREVTAMAQSIAEIEPQIEEFFAQNEALMAADKLEEKAKTAKLNQLAEEVIQDEAKSKFVQKLKTEFKKHHLSEGYFTQRDQLVALFDALDSKAQEKEELPNVPVQPAQQSEAQPESPVVDSPVSVEEKEEAPVQAAEPTQADLLPAAENNLVDLVQILGRYKEMRSKEKFRHFPIPAFQFTKADKLQSVDRLIEALGDKNCELDAKDRAVLNNGRIKQRILSYLNNNQAKVKAFFTTEEDIVSIDQLVDQINHRDPVNKLIAHLDSYVATRGKQADTFRLSLFNQYTKLNKTSAANALVDLLKKNSEHLDEGDKKALKQGNLGTLVKQFIKEHSVALGQAYETRPIKSLESLIRAASKSRNGPKPD